MDKEPMRTPRSAKRSPQLSQLTYAVCVNCNAWPAPRYLDGHNRLCEECFADLRVKS